MATYKRTAAITPYKRSRRIALRQLILLLSLVAVLIILINSLVVSYRVQRDLIINSVIKSNQAYAAKQASSISGFLDTTQQQLAYSASLLRKEFNNSNFRQDEVNRLHQQTNSFNSVVLVDRDGIIRATDPNLGLAGRQVASETALVALRMRQAWISPPFTSRTGNLIVFISQPIFNTAGNYLGYIGGSIYLMEANMLSTILGYHYYTDGSYIYVVDQNRRLLFSPETEKAGTKIVENLTVDKVTAGESGGMRLSTHDGADVLAGYAPVSKTGWGVIVQKSTSSALAPLSNSVMMVLLNSSPLAVLIIVGIVWLSRRIAKPLNELADGAKKMDQPGIDVDINATKAWYFEATELKRAMLIGIDLVQDTIKRLNHDATVDALTSLFNRRRQDEAVEKWSKENRPFAILRVDVDFFKKINDTYGHDTGDRVLQQLALLLRESTREHDIACRVGGDEFTLLLPNTKIAVALQVAQRLSKRIAHFSFPDVGPISVSMGIAHWPEHGLDIPGTFKRADDMLYKAKEQGRNRVVVD